MQVVNTPHMPTVKIMLLPAIAAAFILDIAGAGSPAFAAGGGTATQAASAVTIPANSATPVDVGTVNSQFSITVTAQGQAMWAQDCGAACTTGPDGTTQLGGALTGVTGALAPDLPIGTLIGRLGTDGPWFKIGAGGTIPAQMTSADLYLAYNDSYFADNSGGYTATVERTKSGAN